jgi:hypothetical protein
MTHIKYPNELGAPVPYEPNWKNEAMRQNALLHGAMMGSANAEARVAQLELERDALLRVVTDNHVALTRAEDAEAKLAKAVKALRPFANAAETWEPDDGDSNLGARIEHPHYGLERHAEFTFGDLRHARATLAELEKTE